MRLCSLFPLTIALMILPLFLVGTARGDGYATGYRAANDQKKPLVVWVAWEDPNTEKHVAAIHAHVDAFEDSSTPRVCVFWFDAEKNGLFWERDSNILKAGVDAESVRRATRCPGQAEDALDELNEQRRQRGLRAYVRDEGLMVAARAAAKYRAERNIFGHVNDWSFLPPGTTCSCTGCAGNEARYGFMACECYGHWTYAGAAKVVKSGKAYCHLYLR